MSTTSESSIEPDAEDFLDIIAPAIKSLEKSCPAEFDWDTVRGTSLESSRDAMLVHLDKLVEWAEQMEEFLWSYGCQLLGQDEWMPATDSVQDYKARMRSLRKAIQANNTAYFRSNDLLTESSPPGLNCDALKSYTATDGVLSFLREAREKVDVLENSLSVVIPCTDSPPDVSAV